MRNTLTATFLLTLCGFATLSIALGSWWGLLGVLPMDCAPQIPLLGTDA